MAYTLSKAPVLFSTDAAMRKRLMQRLLERTEVELQLVAMYEEGESRAHA